MAGKHSSRKLAGQACVAVHVRNGIGLLRYVFELYYLTAVSCFGSTGIVSSFKIRISSML